MLNTSGAIRMVQNFQPFRKQEHSANLLDFRKVLDRTLDHLARNPGASIHAKAHARVLCTCFDSYSHLLSHFTYLVEMVLPHLRQANRKALQQVDELKQEICFRDGARKSASDLADVLLNKCLQCYEKAALGGGASHE